jgi:hypothetical protein
MRASFSSTIYRDAILLRVVVERLPGDRRMKQARMKRDLADRFGGQENL